MAAPTKRTFPPGSSYRFDDDTKALIKALAAELGASDTQVLKLAVRALAKRHGIRVLHDTDPKEGE